MAAPVSARFLQVASRYQVQLGWLRVIAASIGDGRMSIEQVAEVLLSHRERFNSWWEQTGLEGPARGIAQPATANRAARIGVTYGIHDPDSGRLTPWGQVLRHAAPWRRSESPLIWRGGARWLGLWLTMSAAGDVLLSVLRSWPEEGIEAEEAPEFIAGLLRIMAESAPPDTQRQMLDQAGRAGGKLRFARNFLIYPYLEPLRDLGYLRVAGKAGGYQLTAEGVLLRTALSDGRSAAEWLTSGLHGAFLSASSLTPGPLKPALFSSLLSTLPDALGGAGGADLQPILLMAQARLSEPGVDAAVLEQSDGQTWLQRAADRSGGRLTLSDDRLAWRDLSSDMWQQPTQSVTPFPAPASAPTTPGTARGWLQATAALLQPSAPGEVLCWGGPRSALQQLRAWLEAGHPRAAAPLDVLDAFPSTPGSAAHLRQRVIERWNSDLPGDALLATLRRAQMAADVDARAKMADLQADLTAPDAIGQTRTLLGDAMAVDGWRREELLDQLCQRVAALGEADGAVAFVGDLLAPPTAYTYVQVLDTPLPLGQSAGV